MAKEIEAKYLKIDPKDIKHKLKLIRAKKVFSKKLFKRYVFGGEKDKWIRVRTDGRKTVLTYKYFDPKLKAIGMQETEVAVSNFEDMVQILKSIYTDSSIYQENYREEWVKGNTKFDIDYWPQIDPALEIEAISEEELIKNTNMLELDYSKAEFGGWSEIYKKYYGVNLSQIQVLKFKA